MGSALCSLFRQKPVKILYFGLDAVGKTTLLYRLKLGEIVTTIPTIGFNVETLHVNGMSMLTWDVGLRDKGRPLIRHYLDNTDAIVFMIDSSDRERLDEAVEDFFRFVYDTVQERQLPVLVLANKQDRPNVMSPEEIKAALFKKGREAFRIHTALDVFPIVAVSLEGVDPALNWLTSQLALRIARDAYLPSWLSLSTATHYPVSFMKSAYSTVAGLLSSKGDTEKPSEDLTAKT